MDVFDSLMDVLSKGVNELGGAYIATTKADILGQPVVQPMYQDQTGYTKPAMQPNVPASSIGGAVQYVAAPGGNAVPATNITVAGVDAKQLMLGAGVILIGVWLLKG